MYSSVGLSSLFTLKLHPSLSQEQANCRLDQGEEESGVGGYDENDCDYN